MAMKDPSGDDEIISDINVTPFVDVVLVLLILFMLAAPAVYQNAVRIRLPESVSSESVNHVTLRITIDAKGESRIDGQILQGEALKAHIEKALRLDPKADAIVFADRATTHDRLIAAIDVLQGNGIRQVALGVESRK